MTVLVPRAVDFLPHYVSDARQLRTRTLDLRAYAHDASHYLLYPEAVIAPKNADEISKLLYAAGSRGLKLTFRAGGTSLSGQSCTDKVLVDVRANFQGIEVLDDGKRVRVQPGLTVDQVNAFLAPYRTKLGPDPASSRACTIGGVVANNSSGMACGTVENTYQTIDSIVAVLPSGTIIDTGAADADDKLRLTEPALYEGLAKLRDRIRSNPESVAKIKQQFSMKNTMGYSVNSFIDHDRIIDIFTHLLVGSEGTLAFIAEATFRTIPVKPFVETSLLVFEDIYHATSALPALVASGAATLELMDTMSLKVGQSFDDSPAVIKALNVKDQAALLLEYQAGTADALRAAIEAAQPTLTDLPVAQPVDLTADPKIRGELWGLRNGLLTSVAGARKPGTIALLEDVVVPVAKLADTCGELSKLFLQYGYGESAVFGHAKDGNVHFMITDRFEGEALDRFHGFTEGLVDLILAQSGALKAEHGAGRVMAPYVERQFGSELYDVMRELKKLFDPTGLLGSDVIISDDPDVHMKHIKPPVLYDKDFDRCSECGFCEPVCPSRDLTMTPRQRLVSRREIAMAVQQGDRELAVELEKQYAYNGIQTCAVDGLCMTVCPLKINTADMTRKLRAQSVPKPASALWTTAAKHWEGTTTLAGLAMNVTHALRPLSPVIRGVNKLGRAVLGSDNVPLWSKEMPGGGPKRKRPAAPQPDAVYLPACVNRMFGAAGSGGGVQAAFEKLCASAGITLLVPQGVEKLCCGTPWSSKGIRPGYQAMTDAVLPTLREVTDGGRLPVICDASSCTEGFGKIAKTDPELNVQIIDAVQFVADVVLPKLGAFPKIPSVTLHRTCSSTQLGLNPALSKVAEAVAEEVVIPTRGGCCAFAGDRGMLHPELTQAATRIEAAEVATTPTSAYASCNRTCELGMTRATGQTYQHVLELLAAQVAKG